MTETCTERYWQYLPDDGVWAYFSSDMPPMILQTVPGFEEIPGISVVVIGDSDDERAKRRTENYWVNGANVTVWAALDWARENELFEKSAQGIYRIDVPADVTGF